MAQVFHTLTVTVSLPWWWRPYLWALVFYEHTIGGVDTEIAARFIAAHVQFFEIDNNGRRHRIHPSDLDLDQP